MAFLRSRLKFTNDQRSDFNLGLRQGLALWAALGGLGLASLIAPGDNGHGATIFGGIPGLSGWLALFPAFLAGGAGLRLLRSPRLRTQRF